MSTTDDGFPIRMTIPKGYRTTLDGEQVPWFERDGELLELVLHADGAVTWQIVDASCGAVVYPVEAVES